jgi:alkylated DNA repair dioxygenase AlkB
MLTERIDATDPTPFKFKGWTGKRLTTSFGWSYDFEAERPVAAELLPDWLLPIRDRSARFARLDPILLIQALLICYDPGAGIGWHRDRPVYQDVIGISLGESATIRFPAPTRGWLRTVVGPARTRAAYHLSGPARHDWEHSNVEMDRPRWSVTFRSLSAIGHRILAR